MGITRFLLLSYSCMGFLSCTNSKVTNDDIDKFISKYQTETFDNLKDIFIFQRSSDFNGVVYGVGKYEGNKPLYFVEYNTSRHSITSVNKSLLEKDSVADYLLQSEIANAINTIRKYDFFLLAVDSSKNVYINPFYTNEPAYLLRLHISTSDSIVKKGSIYKLYKGNWYIRE